MCCIVFDIDGMMFEFFMNFLNIEKNKIIFFLFLIFQVFFAFHATSNIKKKIGVKKKIRGGGGGVDFFIFIFLDKTTLSDLTFYAIFNIKKIVLYSGNIVRCPFTYSYK